MVRVEVGGHPIISIPGVEISTARTRVRQQTNTGSRFHLNWSTVQARLVVTSDTEDFDEEILSHLQEEEYQIWYLPYSGDKAAYKAELQHIADPLELGETYAIVAYGDAAALVLEACMRPMPKLAAVVAYYPPYMPKTSSNFPPALNVLIHLAGSQRFGTRHQKNFRYPNTEPGFAESDLDEYSKPEARIAWSRTLATLRRGFGAEEDLESIWDYHTRMEVEEKDINAMMETMTSKPYINHVPTMTGGTGQKNVKRFYGDFCMPDEPPDMKRRLLSRTVGTDRIVDEILISCTHSKEVPWMLPGVAPTGKDVEVVVVVIAAIRGGKVCHKHVHWDQASVLFQVGLLDPKQIPSSFSTTESGKEEKLEQLPVFGKESARKVVDERKGPSNKLIPGW